MKAITLIDWLTFTVHYWGSDWESVVKEILGMDPNLFLQVPRGRYGYRASAEYNNIVVYYNGRENAGGDAEGRDMGICISMSGNGCRTYEDYAEGNSLITLAAKLLKMYDEDNLSVNISRVDIAADDIAGVLSLERMLEYLSKRQVNTRIRKVCENKSYDLGNGNENDSLSFYLGSEKSDFRYRMYDKAKEQGDFEKHWVRVEMVHKGDYAKGAIRALVEAGDKIGQCVAAMIRSTLLFIEADNDRIERCSVAEWWDDFLETLEMVKNLEKIKSVQKADKIYFWVERQLSRSFAMAQQMFGQEFIDYICELGDKNMNENQRTLVCDYMEKRLERHEELHKKRKLELHEKLLKLLKKASEGARAA